MKENEILKNRIIELANRSYSRGIYTYTNFLSPSEMDAFEEAKNEIRGIDYEVFGGTELSERVMIGFGSQESLGYQGEFPITAIKVSPLIDKFSDDMTHRDFLGAIMNLGIERELVGDILLKKSKHSEKNNIAFVFAVDKIAPYIIDNLNKVKHTSIKCEICDPANEEDLKVHTEEMKLIAASARLDTVIAGITKLSRSKTSELFTKKMVNLNGRCYENHSYSLKDGDIFSVRGYGKYIFHGITGETRKGRANISLERYV